jgi:hypothetical protein
MEMYFDPSESAVVERDAVLRGFAEAGLGASAEAEGAFWVVSFEGSSAFISFQERDGRLCFASLDQPTLTEQDTSYRIFCALEGMGWVVDEENVG